MDNRMHMLRLNIAGDIVKLQAHLSLTKDKKLRKRIREVIALKTKKMEEIQ